MTSRLATRDYRWGHFRYSSGVDGKQPFDPIEAAVAWIALLS